MAKSFAATIGKWASKSEERITAVRRRSVELLGDEMTRTKPQGGRVPVDTSNLSKSVLADKNAMPKTAEGPFPGSNVGLVAATLRNDQPLWIGYQANYAKRMEFGFVGADALGRVYNQQGNYFVQRAIAMWPQIVAESVQEVKGNG